MRILTNKEEITGRYTLEMSGNPKKWKMVNNGNQNGYYLPGAPIFPYPNIPAYLPAHDISLKTGQWLLFSPKKRSRKKHGYFSRATLPRWPGPGRIQYCFPIKPVLTYHSPTLIQLSLRITSPTNQVSYGL